MSGTAPGVGLSHGELSFMLAISVYQVKGGTFGSYQAGYVTVCIHLASPVALDHDVCSSNRVKLRMRVQIVGMLVNNFPFFSTEVYPHDTETGWIDQVHIVPMVRGDRTNTLRERAVIKAEK